MLRVSYLVPRCERQDCLANHLLGRFGAVTEEFEVRDAIENALASKSFNPSLLVV
jgi:hypothetical protein